MPLVLLGLHFSLEKCNRQQRFVSRRYLADLNSMPPSEDEPSFQQPISSGADGKESKNKPVSAEGKSSDAEKTGEVTDVQKKMRRAERFGMPVQLSEKEKRNSRAERFGTGPAGSASDIWKQSDELKMKARAERFGILQSNPNAEEAKKKARLARFGSSSPANEVEEDKKKARALRFSVPDSVHRENRKGTIVMNAAVAGKAAGGT